ncbi:hypothetical protein BH09ACT1_BH09ACT1_20500 [soil metagenome]
MRLPEVLTPLELPLAELNAARLDGELFALDEGFVPVDQVEGRRHRALALTQFSAGRLIAEQRTAAWVYGASPSAPPQHQFCAPMGARVTPRSGWMLRLKVREVVIDAADVIELSGLRITTPVRTVVDLVRIADVFGDADAALVRDLMSVTGVTFEDCRALMERRRNLPAKRRALDRLERVSASARLLAGADPIHVVDRIDTTYRVQHPVEVGRVAHLEDEAAECEPVARRGDRRREDVDMIL